MAHYRLSQVDLSTRIDLLARMLNPSRPWGEVSELAREYGVSRKFLYQLRDRGQQTLQEALAPRAPGRKADVSVLTVDHTFVHLAILVLAVVLPGTIRGIQLVLELLFGKHCAIGMISETLQACGQVAQQQNAELEIPLPVLGELDEVFQGSQPCLTVVDGRSFAVLNLAPAESRDATAWGMTLLELLARGIEFHNVVSDGAKGIAAGIREAGLTASHLADLFHLLRKGHQITRKLEATAYRAMEATEQARLAEQDVRDRTSHRGRPHSSPLPYAQALGRESQAIDHYDAWIWLLGEMGCALSPFNAQGELNTTSRARETLQTVADLLTAFDVTQVRSFARNQIQGHMDELLAPLAWLEETLAPYRVDIDSETEAFIIWAWQHRHALEIEVQDLDGIPEQVVQAFWGTLDLFHRASSLAESLHSWLRPYLQVHRGMPQWLLPLLQLFWNHHTFQRGKRKGHCPLELAGVEKVRSLKEVLYSLVEPQLAEQAVS
jgi:hypothetical protein